MLSFGWLCAGLLEEATGSSIQDFVRDRIARPVGVEHSFFLGLPSAPPAPAKTRKGKGKRLWGRGLAAPDPVASGPLSDLLSRCATLSFPLFEQVNAVGGGGGEAGPVVRHAFAHPSPTRHTHTQLAARSALGLQRGAADGAISDALTEQSKGFVPAGAGGEDALDLTAMAERIKGSEHLLDLRLWK